MANLGIFLSKLTLAFGLLSLLMLLGCSSDSSDGIAGYWGTALGGSGAVTGAAATAGTLTTTTITQTTTVTGTGGVQVKAGSGGTVVKAGAGGAGPKAGTGGKAGSAGTAGGKAGSGGTGGAAGTTSPADGCEVSAIPDNIRSSYRMGDHYQKYASANGVLIATGSKVGDDAIIKNCQLLGEMFGNEKIRQAIISDKMWFTMIAQSEQLSDVPEVGTTMYNLRARGLGGMTPTICAEDSIMCMAGDPWNGDCICPHEYGHTLQSSGIARVSEFNSRLNSITSSIESSGRLSGAYVWEDGGATGLMAWGVQAWYNCALDGKAVNNYPYHSDINTRAELQKELPDFYQFLSEILPVDNQYKDCYYKP